MISGMYTVDQINSNNTGNNQIDLSGYAKKSEVGTIIDLDGLKKTIGNKLDRTPEHRHTISSINELQNQLNDKLSKSSTYSFNELIDPETNGTINELTVKNKLTLGETDLQTFITETNAVIKNHYDAIKIIAEKLQLIDSDSNPNDSIIRPTESEQK